MWNSRYSVYFLGQNKPLESLIWYNKQPIVHYSQHNVCKYIKDQDYLIFISKISLGRLKIAVPGVRKINGFLQPWWPLLTLNFALSLSLSLLLLCSLLFIPFGDTHEAEILFPNIFILTYDKLSLMWVEVHSMCANNVIGYQQL